MPTYGTQQKPWFGTLRNDNHWSTKRLIGGWFFRPSGRLIDYSHFKNHGIITGATWASGPYGSCLYFNGNANFVTISPLLSFTTGKPYTIIAWAKRIADE